MFDVRGCQVSEALLRQWSELLVCEPAPFFLPDGVVLADETLMLSRKAFSEVGFDASYRDSYTTYWISPDAKQVVFLSAGEFDALALEMQQILLAAQCEFKRGQVYKWNQVEPFLQEYLEQAESRSIVVSGEKYIVLDAKIWGLFSDNARWRWLVDFATQDTPSTCLSSTLSEADWVKMPYTAIRALAGTFASRSGANCFSTTLAAITQREDTSANIADFWLHQEPFLHGLARRGYCLQADERVQNPDLSDAVLVWQDEQGKAQHACYLIGGGLVLNKNSQAWFSPRQLLKLDTVLNEWKNDPFEIVVYRRAAS